MVTKRLDEIVMEDDVKERIRSFFEQATASGDVSFEHDWQWQAYCDVLYALKKYGPLTKYGGEKVGFLYWDEPKMVNGKVVNTFHERDITLAEYLDIAHIHVANLKRYSLAVRTVLQQSLDQHGLEDTFGFRRIISYDIEGVVDFINRVDDQTTQIAAALQNLNIVKDSGYYKGLYYFLEHSSDEELKEVEEALHRKSFFSMGENRLSEVIASVLFNQHTYKERRVSCVAEAIDCVEINEQKELKGYRILCKIGEGAGRVVYKAFYEKDDCEVAVKVQKKEVEIRSPQRRKQEEDYGTRKRAEHEGRLARQLSHKNIVRYFDRGEFEDGRQYIIEEYVEGNTLEKEIREGSALIWCSVNEQIKEFSIDPDYQIPAEYQIPGLNASGAIKELLEAVSYLHTMGYVHLDIKPANIIINLHTFDIDLHTPDSLKLGDLEFVTRVSQGNSTSTNCTSYGSRIYTAPELLEQQQLSRRADIFSLGIVLYELFEIEHPFLPATDPLECKEENITSCPYHFTLYVSVPIKQVDRDFTEEDKKVIVRNICNPEYYATLEEKIQASKTIPEKYKPVIARCLKYNSQERYADAIEMEEDFSKIEGSEVKREEIAKKRAKTPLYLAIGALLTVGAVVIGVNNNMIEDSSERAAIAEKGAQTLDEEIEIRFPEKDRKEFSEHLDFVYGNLNLPSQEYSTNSQCMLAQHLIGRSGPVGSQNDYRDLAERVLERANEEEPWHANMHYLLGMTYIDQGKIMYGTAEIEEARAIVISQKEQDLSVSIEDIDKTLGVVYASSGDLEGGVLKLGDAYHEDHIENPWTRPLFYMLNQYAKDYCIALEDYEARTSMPFTVVPESERAKMADFCCHINCYDKFDPDGACSPLNQDYPKDENGNILYCEATEPFHCFCGEEISYEDYWMKRVHEETANLATIESGMFSNIFCFDDLKDNVKFKFMGTSTAAWYAE